MKNINTTDIYSNFIFWMFFISSIILLSVFVIYLLNFYYKKRTFKILVTTRGKIRGMVLIALLGATGTSVVIILNYVGSTAIIPTIRIAFQSLVIKISGFLFGPIVGVGTALITEIGIISFVPVYFHLKITMIVVGHGIISGMANKIKDKQGFRFYQILFLLLFLLMWFVITMFFSTISVEKEKLNGVDSIEIKKLFENFTTNITNKFKTTSGSWISTLFFYTSISVFGLLILFSFFMTGFFLFFKKKTKKINKFFHEIIPILFLTIIGEYFISVGISTNMNQDLLGQSTESADILINMSLVIAPIKLTINTIIIYSVWKTVSVFLKEKEFNV